MVWKLGCAGPAAGRVYALEAADWLLYLLVACQLGEIPLYIHTSGLCQELLVHVASCHSCISGVFFWSRDGGEGQGRGAAARGRGVASMGEGALKSADICRTRHGEPLTWGSLLMSQGGCGECSGFVMCLKSVDGSAWMIEAGEWII